jgi:putative flavoprotein involved in K+ transport
MSDETERVQTLVIGGGQAGLAAGYHLTRRGMPFLILDAEERIGDNWRRRWDSLRLFTPAHSDSLPGMRFPGPRFAFPTGREFGDYLEAYAARFRLPVRSGVRADGVRPLDRGRDGFLVTAGGRRFEAEQVVVATGAFQRPGVPEFASELDPAITQLHSSAYRRPSQLREGRVLVVGVSHSGADIAFEVARSHATVLSGKPHGQIPVPLESLRSRVVWPFIVLLASHVATLRTPVGRKMAPKVRHGGGPLLRVRRDDLVRAGVEMVEARVVGVRDGKPLLADGQVLDVANVVWCTGYRPDYGWIDSSVAGEDGWPIQDRGVSPTPGLYFLGIPFLYAFTSMNVNGAGRDAKYVVDRIAARAKATAGARSMEPAAA